MKDFLMKDIDDNEVVRIDDLNWKKTVITFVILVIFKNLVLHVDCNDSNMLFIFSFAELINIETKNTLIHTDYCRQNI